MLGKVTTLEHELGDHTVEARARVAEALGLGAELTEVAGSLGDLFLVEVEVDTFRLSFVEYRTWLIGDLGQKLKIIDEYRWRKHLTCIRGLLRIEG